MDRRTDTSNRRSLITAVGLSVVTAFAGAGIGASLVALLVRLGLVQLELLPHLLPALLAAVLLLAGLGAAGRWPALGGMLIGSAVGLLLYLVLFGAYGWQGLARPVSRTQLLQAWPSLLLWLVLLGGVVAWRGRELVSCLERVLLPGDVSPPARLVVRLAALVGALTMAHRGLGEFLLKEPADLPSFLLAARAMAAGADFYDPAAIASFLDPGQEPRVVFPYLYLPLFAVLLRPLAVLPLPTAYAFVLVLNLCLWPFLLVLCFKLAGPAEQLKLPLVALFLVLLVTFFPTWLAMHQGSPGILVALLVVGTFVLERSGHSRSAGLLLALSGLVKIVPVIVGAYLVMRRSWRTLAAAAVTVAALMAIAVAIAGLGPHVYWFSDVAPGLASGAQTGTFFEPACQPENQWITGVCCRVLGPHHPWFRPISSGLGLLTVLVAGLALWRRNSPSLDRIDGSILVATLLLVSPITWFHHMTMMALPALTLALEAAARPPGKTRHILSTVAVLVTTTMTFQFYLEPWPFIGPSPLLQTIRFQAIVLAFGTFLTLALSRRQHE